MWVIPMAGSLIATQVFRGSIPLTHFPDREFFNEVEKVSKYSITEHGGTKVFPNTKALTEHLDAKYLRTYILKKHKTRIEVICNGSLVGVIKKYRSSKQ